MYAWIGLILRIVIPWPLTKNKKTVGFTCWFLNPSTYPSKNPRFFFLNPTGEFNLHVAMLDFFHPYLHWRFKYPSIWRRVFLNPSMQERVYLTGLAENRCIKSVIANTGLFNLSDQLTCICKYGFLTCHFSSRLNKPVVSKTGKKTRNFFDSFFKPVLTMTVFNPS